MLLRGNINVHGIVQGVGFRPFVYRTAAKFGLKGYVRNLEDASVEIVVEGSKNQVQNFLKALKNEAPSVSSIRKIQVKYEKFSGEFRRFEIKKSNLKHLQYSSMIPPDISICDNCINDIVSVGGRWHSYPFTCCAHCGPRFTAVYELPYDRKRTNMKSFPLCKKCNAEYSNPMDRRFHAQGICCPECGPSVELLDCMGRKLLVDDPFKEAARVLEEGSIVAVKGIGGFHLAAKTTESAPLARLREKKRRPTQPFAIMSLNIEKVRTFAFVSKREEALLKSWQRPIVILRKKTPFPLSKLVSPNLDSVGVMLPYTGVHFRLLSCCNEPALVMTSGNKPGLPMVITNKTALRDLKGIADYFLLHNRKIVNRCDDSVLLQIRNKPVFIRRSRGYTPVPIQVPTNPDDNKLILAFGAEDRNVGAILYKGRCFLTQYVGDTDNYETLKYLENSLAHLKKLQKITCDPSLIACDLHPNYLTSRVAQEKSQKSHIKLIRVQHHHAHITSLMAEHFVKPDETMIGIALDGLGYGTDRSIWGGEIILANYDRFERVGHLAEQPMPGGDLCAKYPLRMLIAILSTMISWDEICDITSHHIQKGLPYGEKEIPIIEKQLKNPLILKTSSTGRLLDAFSAAAGICYKRSYEGEPAITLECYSNLGNWRNLKLEPEFNVKNGKIVLNTSKLLYDAVMSLKNHKLKDVCSAFQHYLAVGIAEIASKIAQKYEIRLIGASGGVMVNRNITCSLRDQLKYHMLHLKYHNFVPPGDGGICLGQAVAAYFMDKCDM
jgi:hydrogenase maturation protein HypF